MELTSNEIVEQHVACEDCGSSDAKCVYGDGHSFCYSCETYTPPEKIDNSIVYSYEYLSWRGIDKSSFSYFDVKTKIDLQGKPIEIGFKYPNSAYKIRQLEKKAFYTVKSSTGAEIGKAGLYGRDRFSAGSHKYLTIVEGELDAISLWQVLKSPVVSVQSSSSAVRDCSIDRAYINSFERVYLCFDNDEKGREAVGKIAKLFDYNKLYLVRLSRFKDANEYLQAGASEELRQIWWNAKKYLPDTVISSFHEFDAILKERPKQGVPYPFPTLNFMTFGIRRGESVLITAMEGVGKT